MKSPNMLTTKWVVLFLQYEEILEKKKKNKNKNSISFQSTIENKRMRTNLNK